jgi:hypothetical protein
MAVGAFATIGMGGGVNVSADCFAGIIFGGPEKITGDSVNLNVIAGPLSVTFLTDPSTHEILGFTVGVGPSATAIGGSASFDVTAARHLHTFAPAGPPTLFGPDLPPSAPPPNPYHFGIVGPIPGQWLSIPGGYLGVNPYAGGFDF